MSPLASVIKYEGDNSTFIWKSDITDFNCYSQLIVHESQEAILFLNGQALDTFGPGRHTLTTENIPILGKLLNLATGGETPFHCEVYFINQTVQMSIKWGTDTRIRFIEPNYGVPLSIGASGEMNIKVSNSRKLLLKLVGTMSGIAWEEQGSSAFTQSLKSCFRPMIMTAVKTNLAAAIKQEGINILEIDENLEKLSAALKTKITPSFEEYGLTVPEFYLTTVLLPEEDRNFQNIRQLHTVELKKAEVMATAGLKKTELAAEAQVTIAQTQVIEAQTQVTLAERELKLEQGTTDIELEKQKGQRTVIEAQAESEANRLKGFSEADVMHAKGYNHKDEIQAEVQKAYAEGIGNMNFSGGAGGVAGDMVGLGVGVAAAGAIAPQLGEMFKGFTGATDGGEKISPDRIKCPTCNAENLSSAKFCSGCGKRIEILGENEVICSSCGQKTPKGRFCIECGAPFTVVCSKCGAELKNGAKFCSECGEKQ